MANFKWNGGRLPWAVRRVVGEAMDDVARRTVYHIKRSISTPYPPASTPGNPPHKRTGNLQRSVDYWTNHQTLETQIGVNVDAPYWSDLEFGTSKMAARPFIRVMIRERARAIKEAIAAGVRRGFRRIKV